ncbi:MAG: 16S rRNA (guanine(527)-N(7))-methyltransferase RsmG [Bacteroidota bacterium]
MLSVKSLQDTEVLEADKRDRWFQSICASNQLPVNKPQADLLQRYVAHLLDWNRKVNLISRKDEQNIWERHILHSVSLLFHVSFDAGARILDLGTGGGLPGIPIKILSPQISLTLIDSIRKKIVAVADIARKLSLTDVKVECGRAEELANREEFRRQFDYVIARGVANLNKLVKWSFPFLRARKFELDFSSNTDSKTFIRSPALIAMKGGNLEVEIMSALKDKDVKDIKAINLSFEGLDRTHDPDRKAVIVFFR